MYPVVNPDLSNTSPRSAMPFGLGRQYDIGIVARGVTRFHTDVEQEAAFRAFITHDLVRFDLNERWGTTFATTLYRGGEKGFTLHMDSDNPEFPNERYDLSQREADEWCADGEDGLAPEIGDWPVVKPWAALEVPSYTPAALAARWQCSRETVSHLIATGELPAYKVGTKKRRVHADQVAEFERRPVVMSKQFARTVSAMEPLPTADVQPVVAHPPWAALTRDIYSPEQIAERWGCSAETVRRLIRRGRLEAFRQGPRLLRVRAATLQTYELARLPEVVSVEEWTAKAALERARKEARNASLAVRRFQMRTRLKPTASEPSAPKRPPSGKSGPPRRS